MKIYELDTQFVARKKILEAKTGVKACDPSFYPDFKGATSRYGYFDHQQNYLLIRGNLKIILYKDRKTLKILINHKGTRMVKDGED